MRNAFGQQNTTFSSQVYAITWVTKKFYGAKFAEICENVLKRNANNWPALKGFQDPKLCFCLLHCFHHIASISFEFGFIQTFTNGFWKSVTMYINIGWIGACLCIWFSFCVWFGVRVWVCNKTWLIITSNSASWIIKHLFNGTNWPEAIQWTLLFYFREMGIFWYVQFQHKMCLSLNRMRHCCKGVNCACLWHTKKELFSLFSSINCIQTSEPTWKYDWTWFSEILLYIVRALSNARIKIIVNKQLVSILSTN